MPLYDLGAVVSRATQLLGNRLDVTLSTSSFYANEAALQIAKSLFHEASETSATTSTTSGVNSVVLPTNFDELISISNVSLTPPRVLTAITPDQIDSENTGSGIPERYLEYADRVELWPSPNSTYSLVLRYRTRFSAMTATTATPSFDTRYGLAWLYKTTELLADSVLDHDAAALWRQKYLSEMAATPSDYALRQRSSRAGQRLSLLDWLGDSQR